MVIFRLGLGILLLVTAPLSVSAEEMKRHPGSIFGAVAVIEDAQTAGVTVAQLHAARSLIDTAATDPVAARAVNAAVVRYCAHMRHALVASRDAENAAEEMAALEVPILRGRDLELAIGVLRAQLRLIDNQLDRLLLNNTPPESKALVKLRRTQSYKEYELDGLLQIQDQDISYGAVERAFVEAEARAASQKTAAVAVIGTVCNCDVDSALISELNMLLGVDPAARVDRTDLDFAGID